MTTNEAMELVLATWAAAWGASAYSALPYGRDGVPFTPVPGQAHAIIESRLINRVQSTMGKDGARKFRERRLLRVECAAPAGQGRRAADAIATLVKETFEGKRLSDVTGQVDMEVAQPMELGDDGTFFKIVVNTVFSFDETR